MTVNTIPARNTLFKAGWFPMLVISGLMVLSYLIMIFADNEPTLFMLFTALSLYAFLVLLIPYREGKRWAWAATWIQVVVFALIAIQGPDFAPYYYGLAAVFTVGQLLTMKYFFSGH